jgi:ABC-type bacteriocin/lantibiotic exporter with double-glycine peptidase domain
MSSPLDPIASQVASPTTPSDGIVAPLHFLLRLAELTHGPSDPALFSAADEHRVVEATWQQTLDGQCASLGLRTRRVVWSAREAFGAAGRGCAFVSVRPNPRGGRPELFAVDRVSRNAVRVSFEAGGSETFDLSGLSTFMGVDGVDTAGSWLVVECRHPASDQPLGPHSHAAGGDHHHASGPPPIDRLLALIRPERSELWAILAFAAAIGGLSLATPIAVQQLVNSIAFGGLVQPVVVLALLLLVVLGLSALMALIQTFVIELLQQRIFVRVVVDVAERIPRAAIRAFDRQYGPELVNRIFEVVTVQKSLSSLLLEGTAAVLQIAVGLLILSFYHPLMLAFSAILIAGIVFVVMVVGRRAVPTAIAESKAKYDVFGWLEELARHPATFRDADQRDFARGHVDTLAATWVGARRDHFRIVLRQHAGTLALQVVASAALLALGGMLVVQGQLTLGQLVASELIITAIVSTVAKLGKQFERFYDLLAAEDKLAHLFDLPLEREGGEELIRRPGAAAIELSGVQFGYGPDIVFSRLDLRLEAGARLALTGPSGSGKSTLLELLFGLREPSSGYVAIDGRDYRELSIESIRDVVALVRGREAFAGTIRENIRVGRHGFDDAEMMRILDAVGLLEEIRQMPDGLDTWISTDGRPLSEVHLTRLMIARALLTKPRVLLVDRVLEDFDQAARERIADLLFAPGVPWTAVVVSDRDDVLARCTQRLHLGSGATVGSDPTAAGASR